jgi:16S rRNA (cytosine1402-N4)-methyltransferase
MIREYGEEPLAGKIARKVVQTRLTEPIETTASLARVVLDAYGGRARTSRVHPATRTFMALRIAVNSELEALRMLLESIENGVNQLRADQPTWLRPGARIGIISFHSLEDRLVKRSMRTLGQIGAAEMLTRKPVTANADEMASNPRSRSAKLRVIRIKGRQDGEPVSK